MERLERLINLVIALRETRRPMPAAEIRRRVAGYGQEDHEAFRRMFERDKADLRALGVPVETAALDRLGEEVGYRIDPKRYDLPAVRLAPDELAALAVALEATGLAQEAGTGLLKLGVDAGDPTSDLGRRSTGLGVDLAAPHRTELMQAQLTRTRVRFRYAPAGRDVSSRTVDPHALVHRRGRWYLVGFDHDRQARRAFRLDRISGPVRTASDAGAFPPPPDVSVDDVVPTVDVGRVQAEARVAPSIAWLVARRARGGGRPDADGWTRFDFEVTDEDVFASWALQFADEFEVLAPASLRARLVERVTAAREVHQ